MARSAPAILGFSSQGLTSLANVIGVLACAQVGGAAEFGEVAMAVAAITAATISCRGVFGMMISIASDDEVLLREEISRAIPAAFILGSTLALAIAAIGLATGSKIWLAAAVCMPFILAQDTFRYSCSAAKTPGTALLSDCIRFIVSVAIYGTAVSTNVITSPQVLGLWGAGSAMAIVIAWPRLGIKPRFKGFCAWIRADIIQRRAFSFDSIVLALTTVTYVGLLGLFLGTVEVAAIRGAGTILGPYNTLVSGVAMVLVPQLVRDGGPVSRSIRSLIPLSVGLATIALVMGSVGLWLPDRYGSLLLGDTWKLASLVLPIMGLEYAIQGVRGVLVNVLRSRRANLGITVNRVISTGGTLAVAIAAPQFGNFIVVAWCMIINAVLGLFIVCTFLLVEHLKEEKLSQRET
ncbi:hypothetical protein [Dietzia sp. SYD-A1]|uniref:hypothetical protein n=1 Tax=Dietzia sp. SYD-A1 TaxID=2780141 RepID=UPI001890CD12|nr:hypothetical protein [Dietzia sp. SYD-A1]